MAKIKAIKARQILDSRGNPTIETDVILEDGSLGRASVPSGRSTGAHEAFELRDGDPKLYNGMSVETAIKNIHELILPKLIGMDAGQQKNIDEAMIALDGTENKSKLGANAILAVSLATAKAEAISQKSELFVYLASLSGNTGKFEMPYGMFNIINGGVHAPGGSDFQEYMIIPKNSPKFSERLRAASEIFHTLGKLLTEKKLPTTVGDEGGYAPPITSNTQGLDLIVEAINRAGYKPGENVFLAMDVAATEFFENEKYNLQRDGKTLDVDGMIAYIEQLTNSYPIISVEDPLQEDDFEGFAKLTQKIGSRVQTVGDDLYTTNLIRLKKGIELKSTNAILIKPNQIGSLSETIATMKLGFENGFKSIVSHRSGDTADSFIADLAVAQHADQVKFGSLSRSERLTKYDRLLEIEELNQQN